MANIYFEIMDKKTLVPSLDSFLLITEQIYSLVKIITPVGEWVLKYMPESKDIVSKDLLSGAIGKYQRELKEIISRNPIRMQEFYFTAFRIQRFLGINIQLNLW